MRLAILISGARSMMLMAFALTFLGSDASGQLPKIPYKNLGVDTIKTDKHLLFGFVLSQKAGGDAECAIDRQWLKATYPDIAEQVENDERKLQTEAQGLLIGRIEKWIAQCNGDRFVRLKLFLEDELSRIKAIEVQSSQSVFVLINLPAKQVSKITQAKADQRHVAGLAYKHGLPDITITASATLEKMLNERNVNVKTETFDLSDKLPILMHESETQWAARQALLEHLLAEGFELQGRGDYLMVAGDPIDPAAILKQFSAAQDDLLRDLAKDLKLDLGAGFQSSDKADWRSIATSKAEKKNYRGVLVHRLEQNLADSTVKVTSDFLARDSNGQWFSVFHTELSNDGSSVKKEELERLQQDQNLKIILPLVESLGGKAQLEQALRSGAATAQALGQARQAFQEFLRPHTQNLGSSPIKLPSAG